MKIHGPIAILGAGSWGSALALVLADNHIPVQLWGHSEAHLNALHAERENKRYLPGVVLPDSINICFTLKEALHNAAAILIVVPSQAFTTVLDEIIALGAGHLPIAWGTKGLAQDARLLSTVAQERLGDHAKLCVLSGPSFATEVAQKQPTAITAASTDKTQAQFWQQLFHNDYFRIYTSEDMIGAQIGGACKNVLAIAVGIAQGLGLGSNARAALLTRGFAEMLRLGAALHAKQHTLMGLSGMGDLILTCTDNQSRNRRFGVLIGQNAANTVIDQVVEGKKTAALIYQLAQQLKIEMPITEQVYKILYEGQSAKQAVKDLLMRGPKEEEI